MVLLYVDWCFIIYYKWYDESWVILHDTNMSSCMIGLCMYVYVKIIIYAWYIHMHCCFSNCASQYHSPDRILLSFSSVLSWEFEQVFKAEQQWQIAVVLSDRQILELLPKLWIMKRLPEHWLHPRCVYWHIGQFCNSQLKFITHLDGLSPANIVGANRNLLPMDNTKKKKKIPHDHLFLLVFGLKLLIFPLPTAKTVLSFWNWQ